MAGRPKRRPRLSAGTQYSRAKKARKNPTFELTGFDFKLLVEQMYHASLAASYRGHSRQSGLLFSLAEQLREQLDLPDSIEWRKKVIEAREKARGNPTEAECDARVRKALSRKKKKVKTIDVSWESPTDFPPMPSFVHPSSRPTVGGSQVTTIAKGNPSLKPGSTIRHFHGSSVIWRVVGLDPKASEDHGEHVWTIEQIAGKTKRKSPRNLKQSTADLYYVDAESAPVKTIYRKNPKSSKKEFVEQAWAKRAHRLPAHDYEPRKGLEGPFQYPSGKVLYWDPREGKYWDPSSDLYLTDEEIWTHIAPRKNPKSRSKSERAKQRRLRRLKERAGAQSSTEHITEDPRQKGRFSEHGRRKPMYPEKREERRRSRQKGKGSTRREVPERVSPAKSGKPQKGDRVIIFENLPGGKKRRWPHGRWGEGEVLRSRTKGGGAGRKHGFLAYYVLFQTLRPGEDSIEEWAQWFMEPDYTLEKVEPVKSSQPSARQQEAREEAKLAMDISHAQDLSLEEAWSMVKDTGEFRRWPRKNPKSRKNWRAGPEEKHVGGGWKPRQPSARQQEAQEEAKLAMQISHEQGISLKEAWDIVRSEGAYALLSRGY